MSRDIIAEVYFLAGSVCMGIIITFVYDFILIGRRVARHSIFFLSLEDFLFWAVCAVAVFYMLYEENNGILRWFAVCGAALGMLIYKKTVSGFFVRIISTFILKELHMIKKILKVIFTPLWWVVKKLGGFGKVVLQKGRNLRKYLKKKLTASFKMFKMVINRH